MAKKFKVCKSTELPIISQRDSNYVYFLYDKLALFDGQNMFYDHYAIVEEVPEEPIDAMWYICMDGVIRSRIDYQIVEIAVLEDMSETELLEKAGTIFFYEARRRYLDKRRQIIELPYLNGSYQMSVNMANNIKLDENTVIAFNPETSEFEISGKPQDYDLIFTHDYKGINTSSINTKVEDHKISTELKISGIDGNIIRIAEDGLMADVSDRVPMDLFLDYFEKFIKYKEELNTIIEALDGAIERSQDIVSEEAVTARIRTVLQEEYQGIEFALANFDDWASKFPGIEQRVSDYTSDRFNELYGILSDMIDDATNNPWEELGDENSLEPEPPIEPDTEPEPDPEDPDDPTPESDPDDENPEPDEGDDSEPQQDSNDPINSEDTESDTIDNPKDENITEPEIDPNPKGEDENTGE